MRIEFAFAGDDLFTERDRRRPHCLDLADELVLLFRSQIQGGGVFQHVQDFAFDPERQLLFVANAKPLSEIIKSVEDKGYKTITELEFDDGVWKVEVHQPDGTEVHIKVDPVSGAIRPVYSTN